MGFILPGVRNPFSGRGRRAGARARAARAGARAGRGRVGLAAGAATSAAGAAVGDDRIEQRVRGRVTPGGLGLRHSSVQRRQWFLQGCRTGGPPAVQHPPVTACPPLSVPPAMLLRRSHSRARSRADKG
ncbi:neutral zinc metallopeptidase [Streptomyces sp. NPDC127106]|uniref:neutral zinc metallopeptidase n=1 Tax=Streptomyces sp. NPDC127106 TaxID=3345360 RepID=UPI00363AB0A9